MVVLDSVPAGLDVVVLVVVSVEVVALGLALGETVSVFCSQAASNAAPARMQMYFFIGLFVKKPILGQIMNRSKAAFRLLFTVCLQATFGSKGRDVAQTVGLRHCLTGKSPIAGVNPTAKCRVQLTRLFQTMIGQ